MTQSKHTPAPWYINQFKGKYYRVSPNEFGCNNKDDYVAHQINNESNAYLIAAAPELLEALEGMMKIKGTWLKGMDGCEISKYPEMAKKAIKKARGES